MLTAPILQEVAAEMTGTPSSTLLTEPSKWAYALREACELARPDWVLTHHDLSLEADALSAEMRDSSQPGVPSIVALAAGRAVATLTETLAALYPDSVVAASLTGPATVAAGVAERLGIGTEEERLDLLDDCADGCADLCAELIERGAGRLVVWEPGSGGFDDEDVASAHRPLLRRAEVLGASTVLCAQADRGEGRYGVVAGPGGQRARLLDPAAFRACASVAALLDPIERDGVELVLSDGPLPGDCDLNLIRELGERAAAAR